MNDGITLTIAIYGALLSSILLGWKIYRDLTDRGRLRVHCSIGKIVIPGGPKDENDYLFYNVTNIGRKPIVVTHIGGSMTQQNFMILPKDLPKTLKPGEFSHEYTTDLSCLNDNLLCLWAMDSLGKYHKVKRCVLKDLIKKEKNKNKNAT